MAKFVINRYAWSTTSRTLEFMADENAKFLGFEASMHEPAVWLASTVPDSGEPELFTAQYNYNTTRQPPPAVGQCRINNNPPDATLAFLNAQDADGNLALTQLIQIVPSTVLELRGVNDPGRYIRFNVEGPAVDKGYVEIPVSMIEQGTALSNGGLISVGCVVGPTTAGIGTVMRRFRLFLAGDTFDDTKYKYCSTVFINTGFWAGRSILCFEELNPV